MYLTSGAKVSTRRSRSLRSPVVLYCCQSASVSSADMRRAVAVFMGTRFSCGGRDEGDFGTVNLLGYWSRTSEGGPDGSRTHVQTRYSPEVGRDPVAPGTLPLQAHSRVPITPDTMALRLSKPQNPTPRTTVDAAELAGRARALLATG